MVNIVISILLLLFPVKTEHESFEGKIDLVQKTCYETMYFTYLIQDKNVRIDKFDHDHKILQSLIIDLNKEEIFILSPDKKLYTILKPANDNFTETETFSISKTDNSKLVNGIKCYQWRVKNADRNTEVAYWVFQDNFYFFNDLIKLLNRTDKTYEFFEKIPDTQGFFPMLSVERTLLRKEKLRTSVVNIDKKKIDDSYFIIPDDYAIVKN